MVSIDIYILIIENICFDFLRTSYQEKYIKKCFENKCAGYLKEAFIINIDDMNFQQYYFNFLRIKSKDVKKSNLYSKKRK